MLDFRFNGHDFSSVQPLGTSGAAGGIRA